MSLGSADGPMNGNNPCLAVVVLAALAALAQPSVAAESGLAERFGACTRERDDAQRLACFDSAAAQLPKSATVDKPRAEPVAGSVTPLPTTASEEAFGVSGSELARKRDAEIPVKESAPRRITATLTEVSKRPRGELVFTLDNGQVWAQKDPGSYFPIKVGDSVTILAGSLGSFRLVTSNRSTQVTRVE